MKTIELKLYKPSSSKRNVIDEALENYSRAYAYLMNKAYAEIDNIKENYKSSAGYYKTRDIVKWIDKETLKKLNRFSAEPFKDSIKLDFSAALAGLLNNKTAKSIDGMQMNFKERPIYFCRYSKNRNYSLLHDTKNNKYYAKLYLMNVKNEKRKKAMGNYNRKLDYIAHDKEPYIENDKKRSFIMVPLAFGRWQEEYLKEAISTPDILKTARLIKRNKEYYLAINIVRNVNEAPPPINYMGISRGMNKTINYTVVDNRGSILLEGYESVSAFSKDKLNIIANSLVNIAYKNRCQVIVEKLTDKGDNLSYKDKQGRQYIPIINCSNYNSLHDIISNKLKANGMKSPIRVSAVRIFSTCPYCNHNSKANRFSNKILLCTSCGKTIEVEKAGSINLARKLIHYSSEKILIIVKKTNKGIVFINEEIGLKYYPTNPFDCQKEFMEAIDKIVTDFYDNLSLEKESENYKKKLSLIKRLEADKSNLKLVEEN